MEHIPDVGLDDIQEDDENQREENIESEHEVIDEDGSKHVTVNQDGVTSDETDSESFSKSRNLNVRESTFVKGFKSRSVPLIGSHNVRGHFVMLIEAVMHLISCNSGQKGRQVLW